MSLLTQLVVLDVGLACLRVCVLFAVGDGDGWFEVGVRTADESACYVYEARLRGLGLGARRDPLIHSVFYYWEESEWHMEDTSLCRPYGA